MSVPFSRSCEEFCCLPDRAGGEGFVFHAREWNEKGESTGQGMGRPTMNTSKRQGGTGSVVAVFRYLTRR
jgi:hypothetical protein